MFINESHNGDIVNCSVNHLSVAVRHKSGPRMQTSFDDRLRMKLSTNGNPTAQDSLWCRRTSLKERQTYELQLTQQLQSEKKGQSRCNNKVAERSVLKGHPRMKIESEQTKESDSDLSEQDAGSIETYPTQLKTLHKGLGEKLMLGRE